jgi:hypothetical protein
MQRIKHRLHPVSTVCTRSLSACAVLVPELPRVQGTLDSTRRISTITSPKYRSYSTRTSPSTSISIIQLLKNRFVGTDGDACLIRARIDHFSHVPAAQELFGILKGPASQPSRRTPLPTPSCSHLVAGTSYTSRARSAVQLLVSGTSGTSVGIEYCSCSAHADRIVGTRVAVATCPNPQ